MIGPVAAACLEVLAAKAREIWTLEDDPFAPIEAISE